MRVPPARTTAFPAQHLAWREVDQRHAKLTKDRSESLPLLLQLFYGAAKQHFYSRPVGATGICFKV